MGSDLPDAAPRRARYLWLLVPSLLMWASFRASAGCGSIYDVGSATVIAPWAWESLYWSSFVSVAALLALRLRFERSFPHPGLSLGLVGPLLVAPCFMCWLYIPLYASPGIRGPDGRDWSVLESSFLQAQRIALGRVTSSGPGWRTFGVLAASNLDNPRYYASVIRADGTATDAAVGFSPDGLAIDIVDGRAFVAASLDGHRSLKWDDVQDLSPFVLLDSTGSGRESDVTAIESDVRSTRAFYKDQPSRLSALSMDARSGIPTDASLLAALDSPNAWIRAASRRLVEAGGAEMYPEATRRLATAPK